MTDVKDQEHLRDTISSVLEISRASWKLKNNQEAYEEEINEGDFPRSMLLRTLTRHPLASAATAAALWYVGPARFGAMAVAGISLFMRHRMSILPLAEQLMTSSILKPRKKPTQASEPD
ncbi:hypothetical protein [Cellvibrio sp. PSBB006]|jgi:hypothetical protein|uniref:hypothetical protein n=1 Tax=Cellvibrio sp. PSBB006 TaxID=1987723 RepID=UPI000B3B8713|nr:hypothetical protein [Cellvibrio sp. PSBB006]ARU26981.1 hypothetical protein CBR65_05760 [Cellvibrio sp. PSBB006]